MRYGFRFAAIALTAGTLVQAQAPAPFKLGTFERQGKPFVGVVVGNATVIEFAAATDMKNLISRYAELRPRIVETVATVARAGANRPAYVHDLAAVKTLPPIMYPTTMLNVAVNYREHDVEMSHVREAAPGQTAPTAGSAPAGTRSAPGYWERRADDTRWNPYMFFKAPAAVTAHGEPIRLPPGRTQVDWECEMGVVIGREAHRVAAAQANDYIFGYTLENDVSDRGGRGDNRYGSDWVVGKSHDTFAPLGPFITPKEFVSDPRKVAITVDLNGMRIQEGSSSLMIHDVYEQVAYGSNIITLRPGDVIATGTPAGVGSARTPPVFLKSGDRISCTYEGVGTLSNPVVSETISSR
jgi:2-keto-4-pentenoate hydratase/2-oxohepta-3-ene-1,7-dioic acid hydratase in catechol pathway